MKREKLFAVDVHISGEKTPRYITNVSRIKEEKYFLIFEREEGRVTFNKNFVVAYEVHEYAEPIDENDFFQDAKKLWHQQNRTECEQYERPAGSGGYQPRKVENEGPDNPPKNPNGPTPVNSNRPKPTPFSPKKVKP